MSEGDTEPTVTHPAISPTIKVGASAKWMNAITTGGTELLHDDCIRRSAVDKDCRVRARIFPSDLARCLVSEFLNSGLKETAIPGENLVICLLMISSKLGGGAGRRQADFF